MDGMVNSNLYKKINENIDIAIIEAIVTFGRNEGKFSEQIFSHYCKYKSAEKNEDQRNILNDYESKFTKFATVFKIVRNMPLSKRHLLVEFVFNEYLPKLDETFSPELIDYCSDKASQKELTKGKLTSAFSKIAFIYKPDKYFPYDKTAKESLEGHLIESNYFVKLNRNYKNFSDISESAFCEWNDKFQIKKYIINKNYITNQTINKFKLDKCLNSLRNICAKIGIRDVNEFICRRAWDKSLMLIGGFNKNNFDAFLEQILT